MDDNAEIDQGYDETRFEGEVSENFKCPICLNVLKEPLQCQGNEHYFCTPCINRHLEGPAQSCPVCVQPLTLENVRRAPRIVAQCILELKIHCKFVERGCPKLVSVAKLAAHVGECGFAPVECTRCQGVICKADQRQHELECGSLQRDKEFQDNMRRGLNEVNHYLARTKEQFQYELKRYQGETRRELAHIKQNVAEMRTQLEDCRRTQERSRVQLVQFMTEMRDEVKRLTANQQLSSRELAIPVAREATIFICGGFRDNSGKPTNSVEMYHKVTQSWKLTNPMNMRRAEASAAVYGNSVIVSGGWTSENATSTVEVLNVGQIQSPTLWKKSPIELPEALFAHRCVVYKKDSMVVTGGWRPDTQDCLNKIVELDVEGQPQLSPWLISNMPEPRCLHAAKIVGDKLYILGGTTSNQAEDATASVLMYHITTGLQCYSEPVKLPPLPIAVSAMASVAWEDKIILAGGKDVSGKALATVIMYHTKTGLSNFLQSMKQRRDGGSAVLLDDQVIVMGGKDENNHVLNTVECYDFTRFTWEELPPMTEPRAAASAVVMGRP